MSNALAQVEQMHRERQAAAEAAYRELVRSLADDEEQTPETIDAVLTTAGKTIKELYSDTASRRHRNQLRATVAEADTLAKAKPKWDAEVERLKEVRQAAEDAYTEAMRPIRAKLQEYQDAQLAKATATADLRNSAPDSVKDARKRLNTAAQAANAEWRAAREQLDSLQIAYGVKAATGGWERVGDPNRSVLLDSEAQQTKLDAAQARLDEAAAAMAKVSEQQQTLEQQAMEA